MNTLLHFLLLCQSCRSLRNISLGGHILGLIKSAYHGWLSMMTSSEGPPFYSCLGTPKPKPTTEYIKDALLQGPSLLEKFGGQTLCDMYVLVHITQI